MKPKELNPNMLILLDSPVVSSLITMIRHGDTPNRLAAVLQAPFIGTEAIPALGIVFASTNVGASKAACEAIKRIVMNAGRPGAKTESVAASAALLKLAAPSNPRTVRADAIQWLGYVGGAEEAEALAGMLSDDDVRDDCIMAIERIPGIEVDGILKKHARGSNSKVQAAVNLALRHRHISLKDVGVKK